MLFYLPIIAGVISFFFGGGGRAPPDHFKNYRVGSDHYRIRFRYNLAKKYWELWVLNRPQIPATRNNKVDESHLYSNGQICVTEGKEPKSLDIARAIAQHWVHGFSRWVATGQFGKNGGIKVNVPD